MEVLEFTSILLVLLEFAAVMDALLGIGVLALYRRYKRSKLHANVLPLAMVNPTRIAREYTRRLTASL